MRISALESGLLKKNADGTELQASSENNGMNNEGLTGKFLSLHLKLYFKRKQLPKLPPEKKQEQKPSFHA